MDGFPVSVFTAIPVSSGSSDYYGSCVTMPARKTGLGHPHLAKLEHSFLCFRQICDVRHLTAVLRLLISEYHAPV